MLARVRGAAAANIDVRAGKPALTEIGYGLFAFAIGFLRIYGQRDREFPDCGRKGLATFVKSKSLVCVKNSWLCQICIWLHACSGRIDYLGNELQEMECYLRSFRVVS